MLNKFTLNLLIGSLIIFILGSLFYLNINTKSDDHLISLYDQNLSNYKELTGEINRYFNDSTKDNLDISHYYTDDFVFHSFPASFKKGLTTIKDDYIQGFIRMRDMNMSINIGHSIYLPGIDQDSYEIDGSVRVYYGSLLSLDTNTVEFSGYRTVNFRDGKVSEIWEWADYGGVNLLLNGGDSKLDEF